MVRGSERAQLLGRHLRKFGPSGSRRGYYYCARCGAPVSRRELEENHRKRPKCITRIFLKSRRRIKTPSLKLTRQTQTGFKLLAQSKGSIQEVFIVVSGSREKVRKSLRSLGVK